MIGEAIFIWALVLAYGYARWRLHQKLQAKKARHATRHIL